MNISDLKSTLSKRGGVAVQNRFKVDILPPASLKLGADGARDLTILCESCTMPGRQISTVDYQLLQHSFKIPSGFTLDDVTLTFVLTNDFFPKKLFEAWAASTIDFNLYKAKYLEDYRGTIVIHQLAKGYWTDEDEPNIVQSVKLIDAFPIQLSAINLDNTAENSVQKFSVVIAYKNFELINI